ncbi:hypothetical protein [Nocardia alni]|uniref:hypothetical protein n=1 Tax=Nocardia alni TaxID=2815723 RepID=UPI001C233A16|nr:hypothetical protein [Nocardia alni]
MMIPLMYDPITTAALELIDLAKPKGHRVAWNYSHGQFAVEPVGVSKKPFTWFATADEAKTYIDQLPITA